MSISGCDSALKYARYYHWGETGWRVYTVYYFLQVQVTIQWFQIKALKKKKRQPIRLDKKSLPQLLSCQEKNPF